MIRVPANSATAPWRFAKAEPALTTALAVPLLRAFGLVAGGHYLGIDARAALRRLTTETVGNSFPAAKPVTARFYAEHLLGRVERFRAAVVDGAATVMALDCAQL